MYSFVGVQIWEQMQKSPIYRNYHRADSRQEADYVAVGGFCPPNGRPFKFGQYVEEEEEDGDLEDSEFF